MPAELPYLASYKNVGRLFEKIRAAKVPDSFTQRYLSDTLGLKSTGDRPLIALLKHLGMLDASGTPLPRYSALKNDAIAGHEIARGVMEAYAPLFEADENAHELETKDLKGLIAQVAGTDAGATAKIAGTFRSLLAVADFNFKEAANQQATTVEDAVAEVDVPSGATPPDRPEMPSIGGMRPEFHYNIQIHLPANGTEETYLHIFSALRKVFK